MLLSRIGSHLLSSGDLHFDNNRSVLSDPKMHGSP
ncbi:hypothetical protein AWRI1631_163850 [Saccharomyces cerevisiae AWRI1631]|uniref:Uncharacterized protein n=1 Tax=Saccharomyces cerevisiae (strain AWRI1631) TaxID=545124 RepID=B5VTS2_YEAS6|nr:hypothetical protein AWRI1631_163850 [Saccharomyces cerevisiae AWRI1631]